MLQRLIFHILGHLAADTACRLGGTLGVLAWRLGIRRKVVREQFEACLGLRGRRRAELMRLAYASTGAQFLQVWTIGGPDGPERHLEVLNPTWIRHIVRRHPGAVYITAHIGDWDMGAHGMTRFLPEMLAYAKAQHNDGMDLLLNRQRSATGLRIILVTPKDRTGAVLAVKALRRGAGLGLLPDQKPRDGTPAYFLNRPTYCWDGMVYFAAKAKVPIVPGLALRKRAGRSVLFMGRPIPSDGDHATVVQQCMDELTRMAFAHPGQYMWHHRRFAGDVPELPPRAPLPVTGR